MGPKKDASMLRGIRGGIGWNILSSLMQRFAILAANFECKAGGEFQGMRSESAFTTNGYRNWKHATERNRGFSKHAASKEHLTCRSTWEEKIKRFEMGKKITSLVNTEAKKLKEIATMFIDTLESEDEGCGKRPAFTGNH